MSTKIGIGYNKKAESTDKLKEEIAQREDIILELTNKINTLENDAINLKTKLENANKKLSELTSINKGQKK